MEEKEIDVEYENQRMPEKVYFKSIYCPCTRQLERSNGKPPTGRRKIYLPWNDAMNSSFVKRFNDQYKIYRAKWKEHALDVRRGNISPCKLYDKIVVENDLDLLGKACDFELAPKKVKKTKEIEERIDKKEIKEDSKIVEKSGNSNKKKRTIATVYQGIQLEIPDETGRTMAILGSSSRGKTNLFKYIYKNHYSGKKWISTIYTRNPHVVKRLRGLKVHVGFGEEEERVIKAEQLINSECLNSDGMSKYNFFNAFDDLIKVSSSSTFQDMILTYRNANISTCVLMQYSNLLSKMTRGNFNYLFFFRFNTDEAIEVVVKSFLGSMFKQKYKVRLLADQIKLYKKLTENYRFIFLDQLNDKISIHKVPLQK